MYSIIFIKILTHILYFLPCIGGIYSYECAKYFKSIYSAKYAFMLIVLHHTYQIVVSIYVIAFLLSKI